MNPKLLADSADAPPGGPRHPGKGFFAYPPELLAIHIDGNVTVRYVLDSAGRVVQPSIQVLQASRHEFAESVVRGLRLMEMVPARHAGRPVCALEWDQTFSFSVQH